MVYKHRISFVFVSGLVGVRLPSSVMFLVATGQLVSNWCSANKNGVELINISISQNNPLLTSLLKEHGSGFINYQVYPDTSTTFEAGDTALIIACRQGNSAAVEILLSWGADSNIQNDRGYSALHAAVESNHMDCIRLLLARFYTRVNLQNKLGDTPLLLASKYNNTVEVEALLKLGADQYITNSLGNNAIKEAKLRKHNICLQLLLSPSYAGNPVLAYFYTSWNRVYDNIGLNYKVLSTTLYIMIKNDCTYLLGVLTRISMIKLFKLLR